ncbi:hypothetical protein J2848_005721 [Azospirillum lipoferum]|uniref:Uncharacterized protein n=1 Tax=Azospirillum lipoferum TaxID=193 RepID=A0A5A9GEW1_AZOLI|nr:MULTISPECIES: hypothetical protein [Azospirillum]KAA0592926.1 hypothetical protein FZ942_25710 [Azospirillum lipoferum]MCP1614020.1 hypothetical protein [Azospirillum lipoferum]MDW5537589.1 hypothetical protein [Azospirillum sp. NL1]
MAKRALFTTLTEKGEPFYKHVFKLWFDARSTTDDRGYRTICWADQEWIVKYAAPSGKTGGKITAKMLWYPKDQFGNGTTLSIKIVADSSSGVWSVGYTVDGRAEEDRNKMMDLLSTLKLAAL